MKRGGSPANIAKLPELLRNVREIHTTRCGAEEFRKPVLSNNQTTYDGNGLRNVALRSS
jgi:hypothetical protein